MSVEDREEISSPNSDFIFNIVSQIRPYTVISNSNSLEDGEIVEEYIAPRPILQQPKDLPQLHLSTQVRASTPPFPTTEPVVNLAPDEPMTKEDLDRAKSLVLDLLGWGVTPEYLIEFGLSPGAVYKVFTDLQLRLPSTLGALSPPPSHHRA
ncbi:hypothetical protein J3R82DRAFT_4976 [Butyriboletus roseoflavus]|nr:hypothetical protein J3R82DRAFT_4976 [Butyriboletus roseoflavus]